MYDWLKLVHVLAGMVWLGGLVTLLVLGVRARRGGDADTAARFVGSLRTVGPFVLAPSAGVVVVFGIWMVADSAAWSFGDGWVRAGLALVIAAVAVGAAFLGRTGMAAERAVRAGDHAEVARQLGRWAWGIALLVLLLVVATWDMVVKPGM